jgi:PAS domain-containing protein
VEDITQGIEAESALRQAEQRLTLAQSAAHLGIWYRGWVTNVIWISVEYARLRGLAPDRTTVTRDEWFSAIHPDHRERVEVLRREARERTQLTAPTMHKGHVFAAGGSRCRAIARLILDPATANSTEIQIKSYLAQPTIVRQVFKV